MINLSPQHIATVYWINAALTSLTTCGWQPGIIWNSFYYYFDKELYLFASVNHALWGRRHDSQEQQTLLPTMIDLWPIPQHRFLWELHINHAATLLDILRRFVLVSFSFEVARVVRSNFHGRCGLSRNIVLHVSYAIIIGTLCQGKGTVK